MTTTVGIMAASSAAGASPDCAVVAGVESAVREGGGLAPVPELDTRWLSFSTKRIVPKIERLTKLPRISSIIGSPSYQEFRQELTAHLSYQFRTPRYQATIRWYSVHYF